LEEFDSFLGDLSCFLSLPLPFSSLRSLSTFSLGSDSEDFLRRFTSAERSLDPEEELRDEELESRRLLLEDFFLVRESSELAELDLE